MGSRVVVTGASGFVGRALCEKLHASGYDVLALSRRSVAADLPSVTWRSLDLDHPPDDLASLLEGAEAVFHVAAKVAMWGPAEEFYRTNVEATERLLDASQRAGVRYFIFTSSPSVVAAGGDLINVTERQPYPEHFEGEYQRTKALAEQRVLAADDGSQFRTISLRPHLIFGPGDTNLIPTILSKARAKKLVQIGDGENVSDFTYIDDCVQAHLDALTALRAGRGGGNAYFISQGEPMKLWEFINSVLTGSGLEPIRKRLPFRVAHALASVCEGVVRLLPGRREPFLTRFLVSEMATSHYFDISAARRDLGYRPTVSMKDGLARAIAALSGK